MASKQFTVRYLPVAQEDLAGIADWIAQDSPARAISFIQKLDQKVSHLASAPMLGQQPRHFGLAAKSYRVLIVETYLVFYKISGSLVMIYRVVHGARDLEALL